MRQISTVIMVSALIALAGCSSTRWSWVKNNDHAPSPGTSKEPPTVPQLVDYLNKNAEQIQSLRVDDVDITCTQKLRPFGLRGKMVADKPRNFRLGGDALGNRVVDLGSNNQEFWYWISKADPPHQYYCAYKDLEENRVQAMPFPFQPQWVMETLGFGPYGPPERYTLEFDDKTLKLVEKTTSPQGTPLRKVIVFRREPLPAYSTKPQVTDYLLLDGATSKEICSAQITEVQTLKTGKEIDAVVPRRISLHWPSEQLKLSMRFDGTTLNPPVTPAMFTRQTMKGVQSFNLARMQIDNTPPPQAFTGLGPQARALQGN